ncbi:hypothetical protein ETB97_011804, partial [Aspergillus alliaceus]
EILRTGYSANVRSLAFQPWCQLQEEYAKELEPEEAFPFPISSSLFEYWGFSLNHNTANNTIRATFTLEDQVTQTLLGPANNAFQTQPIEVFEAALFHSFVKTFHDRPPPIIFNESHGREPWDSAIDLSRTVGWFTTLSPTEVLLQDTCDIADSVRCTKDYRRRVPRNGWAYFASRYLNPRGKEAFGNGSIPEVVFNYLGLYQQLERSGSLFHFADEPKGCLPATSGDIHRLAVIDVSAFVVRGRLQFDFTYNKYMKQQGLIQEWVLQCERSLREAARKLVCLEPTYTICDFPLLSLTEKSLGKLVNESLREIEVPFGQVEDIYPCSPIQQGILLSQAKNPQYYQNRVRWKVQSKAVSSPVDVDRLACAWQKVVNRHAILRTVLVKSVSPEGYLDQVVLKDIPTGIRIIRCTDGDPAAAFERHWETIHLDLKCLHSIAFCQTLSGSVHCELRINHAIIDAVSIEILRRELVLAYDGTLPVLPGPSYSDYIQHIRTLPTDKSQQYWQRYLAGIQPCIFPSVTDEQLKDEEIKRELPIRIDRRTSSNLHAFCKQQNLTMSNLFQVAWGLVLRCYTNSGTVCFGYLTSGRDIPICSIEDTVGPFINMLVSRTDFKNTTSLISAMQENQAEYISSLEHQHFPLASILHSLNMSGERLFNTGMSVQKSQSASHMQQSTISLEAASGEDPTEYDVILSIVVNDQDIDASLTYRTTVLSDTQGANVAATFRKALSEIIVNPYRELGRLDLLSNEDLQDIWSWNATVPMPVERCVHDVIAERVHEQPDAQAVCAWDGNLTYREMDELSTRLAHHLVGLGVGPDVIVPLCFEKSMWMPVAMLGVMKAGGASVAMDVTQPEERLRSVVQQVRPAIILSSRINRILAGRLCHATIFPVDEARLGGLHISPDRRLPNIDPSSKLYVVFTSGSTGEPKGAIITHSNFTSAVRYQQDAFGFNSNARVFDFVSYSFDTSWSNFLHSATSGACLCIPSESARKDDIAGSMERMGVNLVQLTPSTARIIDPKTVQSLQKLILGGESITLRDLAMWTSLVDVRVAYGPAECSIAATATTVTGHQVSDIGRGKGLNTWVVEPSENRGLTPIGAV